MRFNAIFLSTLSLRRATHKLKSSSSRPFNFYPRSPCGERPLKRPKKPLKTKISIHALLAESDKKGSGKSTTLTHFYPRSPCGERPPPRIREKVTNHISIHALLAESDHATIKTIQDNTISIHALLAESDGICIYSDSVRRHFYPRSPCGERRGRDLRPAPLGDFYPRSPCGERLAVVSPISRKIYFYPRSPCGERPSRPLASSEVLLFLSTLSLRRATGSVLDVYGGEYISIHALLAESDAGT